jgi:hypothetical protein
MRDDRYLIPSRWRKCSLYNHIRIAFGAHTASYLVATEDSFPSDKAVETFISAEIRAHGACLRCPTSPYGIVPNKMEQFC